VAAVSGGADSVALLHLLARQAPKRGWELVAAHVDHGLRPDSAADAGFVRELAQGLGAGFACRRVEARAAGRSPEEAAREARRAALAEMAAAAGAGAIALAHHADDQAETLLARVLAGTGPSGLAGMRVWSPPFWRPLLPARREELRAWLRARGLPWREDPTNAQPGPLRNRVRSRLLPLARELVNPRAEEALGRLARLCAEEEEHWEAWARGLFAASGRAQGDSLAVELGAVQALDRAELRRLVRWLAGRVAGSGQHLLAPHVEQAAELARGRAGRKLTLPGGLMAWREHADLRLGRAGPPPDFRLRLQGPGAVWLPQLGLWLAVEPAPPPRRPPARGGEAWLPARRVAWPLTIRPPVRGERFRPLGAPGAKRLSRFFIDRKVPPWWRPRSVVVADARGVWWVGPWAPAERARQKPEDSEYLCLRFVDRHEAGSYTKEFDAP
jgi:tRNA(Ile)-lysidine synthase